MRSVCFPLFTLLVVAASAFGQEGRQGPSVDVLQGDVSTPVVLGQAFPLKTDQGEEVQATLQRPTVRPITGAGLFLEVPIDHETTVDMEWPPTIDVDHPTDPSATLWVLRADGGGESGEDVRLADFMEWVFSTTQLNYYEEGYEAEEDEKAAIDLEIAEGRTLVGRRLVYVQDGERWHLDVHGILVDGYVVVTTTDLLAVQETGRKALLKTLFRGLRAQKAVENVTVAYRLRVGEQQHDVLPGQPAKLRLGEESTLSLILTERPFLTWTSHGIAFDFPRASPRPKPLAAP